MLRYFLLVVLCTIALGSEQIPCHDKKYSYTAAIATCSARPMVLDYDKCNNGAAKTVQCNWDGGDCCETTYTNEAARLLYFWYDPSELQPTSAPTVTPRRGYLVLENTTAPAVTAKCDTHGQSTVNPSTAPTTSLPTSVPTLHAFSSTHCASGTGVYLAADDPTLIGAVDSTGALKNSSETPHHTLYASNYPQHWMLLTPSPGEPQHFLN
jgi:hypothetical protein